MSPGDALTELRLRIARIERGGRPAQRLAAVAFGIADIDRRIPGHGLTRGALHELAGAGPEVEHGAAAALFAACLLARTKGPVLWVMERPDLFAPALAAVGLAPDQVVYVEAGKAVLAAMEEGLRHPGLAGVVGEFSGRLGLTPSRRLQLAAEASGAIAFALRRSTRFD
ncbi:MAG: damage-inducible protein, partial [Pseudomonadota bacterium]|nr:damage-inducible protein [Pseudomonadota bacterium]